MKDLDIFDKIVFLMLLLIFMLTLGAVSFSVTTPAHKIYSFDGWIGKFAKYVDES